MQSSADSSQGDETGMVQSGRKEFFSSREMADFPPLSGRRKPAAAFIKL